MNGDQGRASSPAVGEVVHRPNELSDVDVFAAFLRHAEAVRHGLNRFLGWDAAGEFFDHVGDASSVTVHDGQDGLDAFFVVFWASCSHWASSRAMLLFTYQSCHG